MRTRATWSVVFEGRSDHRRDHDEGDSGHSLTQQEQEHNARIVKRRRIVEGVFGIWKQREEEIREQSLVVSMEEDAIHGAGSESPGCAADSDSVEHEEVGDDRAQGMGEGVWRMKRWPKSAQNTFIYPSRIGSAEKLADLTAPLPGQPLPARSTNSRD